MAETASLAGGASCWTHRFHCLPLHRPILTWKRECCFQPGAGLSFQRSAHCGSPIREKFVFLGKPTVPRLSFWTLRDCDFLGHVLHLLFCAAFSRGTRGEWGLLARSRAGFFGGAGMEEPKPGGRRSRSPQSRQRAGVFPSSPCPREEGRQKRGSTEEIKVRGPRRTDGGATGLEKRSRFYAQILRRSVSMDTSHGTRLACLWRFTRSVLGRPALMSRAWT